MDVDIVLLGLLPEWPHVSQDGRSHRSSCSCWPRIDEACRVCFCSFIVLCSSNSNAPLQLFLWFSTTWVFYMKLWGCCLLVQIHNEDQRVYESARWPCGGQIHADNGNSGGLLRSWVPSGSTDISVGWFGVLKLIENLVVCIWWRLSQSLSSNCYCDMSSSEHSKYLMEYIWMYFCPGELKSFPMTKFHSCHILLGK